MNIIPPRLPDGRTDFTTLFLAAEQITKMLKEEFGPAYELTRAMILTKAETPPPAPAVSKPRARRSSRPARLQIVAGTDRAGGPAA